MIKKVIIAAVSARPFVKAASMAGYDVVAIDVFADADTQRAASEVFKVSYADSGFEPRQFLEIIKQIDLKDVHGFVYGSGFEAQPELLQRVAEILPIIGNRPDVVKRIKRARDFFVLLDMLDIPHPEVSFKPLTNANGWLRKEDGGSGGTHVVSASSGELLAEGLYFQKATEGTPVSMLFVSDGKNIREIGFNQQWVSPIPEKPYRYGGIVGNADLQDSSKERLFHIAKKITNEVGLVGLNSLDAIVNEDNIWILEINPRLSSTFDLYQTPDVNLFDLHIQACQGTLNEFPMISKRSKARQVFYAPLDLKIPSHTQWPEWIADIPLPNSDIPKNQPVCTILADAEKAELACDLIKKRLKELCILLKI